MFTARSTFRARGARVNSCLYVLAARLWEQKVLRLDVSVDDASAMEEAQDV